MSAARTAKPHRLPRVPGFVLFGATCCPGRLTAGAMLTLAYDSAGRELSEVRLDGQKAYAFTAGALAWGAERAAERGLEVIGALGPVEGFGLDELEEGCREARLARV